MTKQVEQWICIKFCVTIEHSSAETTQMIQKTVAMGNWWLAASSWQWAHSCIMSHAEFSGETSNHPGNSVPLQPKFGTLWLLTIPKTKITFSDWKNCVRSQDAYFEGGWGVIVLCTMFLVPCILFNKWLYFSYYMAGYLLDRAHTTFCFLYFGPVWTFSLLGCNS